MNFLGFGTVSAQSVFPKTKSVLSVENSSHFQRSRAMTRQKKTNQKTVFHHGQIEFHLYICSLQYSALVWFQILFTLFYFLSPPFASQRMIKNCGQLNHGKERGCFGGVIQSILPYFYPQVCFCTRFVEGFVISERYVAFRQNDKLESIFKLDWHDRLENNEHLTRRPKILDWHKKETPCGAQKTSIAQQQFFIVMFI